MRHSVAWYSSCVQVDLRLRETAAHQCGLDFNPLFEERYDLVLPREYEKTLSPSLDYLQTSKFRNELSALTGYNSTHSGEHNTS
ncbi:MAG TPA: hypothetical protein VK909_19860 [Anaerolineales bacterium]|nr:hypothetical protein [Anaerolineales bacterium]